MATTPELGRWDAVAAARARADVGDGIASVLAFLGMPDVISFAGGFPDPETFPRERVSGFVTLPLELRNVHGLAVLACIITATPGTIWVQLDPARGVVLIHILDLIDEEEWVALIKRRYEAPLIEIFGR